MKNIRLISVIIGFAIAVSFAKAAVIQLSNDSYMEGDEANYQAGFVSEEIMAASFFVESHEYPMDLLSVQVLVGDGTPGGTTQGTFRLHLWADNGSETPGTPLMEPVQVILDAGYLNDIDLNAYELEPVTGGAVRVGLEFLNDPPPSFLSDNDGFITQHANTLYSVNFGWHYSEFYGLTGDWILRLVVDTATAEPTPTVTPTGPQPTSTPPPTYTPYPTFTPVPTYTPYPTSTPRPTFSPLPTYTPYPTPSTNDSYCQLWMPTHHFTPGFPFLLNLIIQNPGDTIDNCHLVVLLAIGGDLFYYPSWSQMFDDQVVDMESGETIIELIPEFIWPEGAGSLDHLMFVCGVFTEEFSDLAAQPDIWLWSFSQ